MKKWLAAALAIGFLLAGCVSPSPETPTPTPPPADRPVSGAGDVVGAWEDGPRRLVLRDDGTLFWVNSWGAEATGTFEVDGASFSIVHTSLVEPDSDAQGAYDRNCPTTGTYEVELVAGANLRFSAIEDECVQRADILASAGDREWTPARPSGPIDTIADLSGVYERQGGQYVQFNEDGTLVMPYITLQYSCGQCHNGQFADTMEAEELKQAAQGYHDLPTPTPLPTATPEPEVTGTPEADLTPTPQS